MSRAGEEDGTEAVSEIEESGTETEVTETKRESAHETAQRVWDEMAEGKSVGDEGAEGEPQENAADSIASNPDNRPDGELAAPVATEEAPEKPIDVDAIPPERFTAEEREGYKRLPKVARRTLKKHIKEIESWAGRKMQEASAEVRRAKMETQELTEVVKPFVPELYNRGISVPQAVARLLASHAELTDPDVEKRTAKWLSIGAESGVHPEILQQIQGLMDAQGAASGDISAHPEIKRLREQNEYVQNQLDEWQTAQAAQPIAFEMKAVIDKVHPVTKQLLYPELHQGGLGVVKPLVEELVNRFPGMSYADALECGVLGLRADGSSYEAAFDQAARAYYSGNFRQPTQTRLPTSTNNTNERAVSAGFSARGASGMVSSQEGNDLGKIPDWARKDSRATAQWVMQQMSKS